MKSFQILNEDTGEVKDMFKYLKGRPAEYRFNGQTGNFQYGDSQILTDEKGRNLKEFSLIPLAWRVFEENLFGRGKKDTWVELFFVDARNRVSHIMLNNSSARELLSMASKLFYDDLEFSQVVLTLIIKKAEKEKEGQKLTWFIAVPSYTEADPETVQKLKEYAIEYPIYAERTMTSTAVYRFKSDSLFIPDEYAQLPEALLETETLEA